MFERRVTCASPAARFPPAASNVYPPRMPTVILADIHANLAALDAILADARSAGEIDDIWCLGDIVGYGPDPSAVIERLRGAATLVAVGGNHDLAACGRMGVEEFNAAAAQAVLWTRRQLTQSDRDFLRQLPLTQIIDDFTLVHGSLRWPEWEYLLSAEQAEAQFELQRTTYSLVGHSHIPFSATQRAGAGTVLQPAADGDVIALGKDRLIANPGGAGQPRDGDPRAAYVLYHAAAGTLVYRRVTYDIATTQQRMAAAGLPAWLSARLSQGR